MERLPVIGLAPDHDGLIREHRPHLELAAQRTDIVRQGREVEILAPIVLGQLLIGLIEGRPNDSVVDTTLTAGLRDPLLSVHQPLVDRGAGMVHRLI